MVEAAAANRCDTIIWILCCNANEIAAAAYLLASSLHNLVMLSTPTRVHDLYRYPRMAD
jgi:hypothetical protein